MTIPSHDASQRMVCHRQATDLRVIAKYRISGFPQREPGGCAALNDHGRCGRVASDEVRERLAYYFLRRGRLRKPCGQKLQALKSLVRKGLGLSHYALPLLLRHLSGKDPGSQNHDGEKCLQCGHLKPWRGCELMPRSVSLGRHDVGYHGDQQPGG